MNSKFIASAVLAVAALSGASAFAQTSQSNLNPEAALAIRPVASASTSEFTRTQVQNDNFKPGQNGEAAAGAWARNQSSVGSVSRAEVRNEAVFSARGMTAGNSTI